MIKSSSSLQPGSSPGSTGHSLDAAGPPSAKGDESPGTPIDGALVGPGPRPTVWWTGLEPRHGICPGVDERGKIHSLPQLRLDHCSRQDILDYFDNTWAITEVLFSGLVSDAAFLRPPVHQLRHPLIFYYGHPAVLYVNKLRVSGLISGPIDAQFEQIFETGVDEMSWDDMSKNEMIWPTVEAVHAYRRQVYRTVKKLIETHPSFAESQRPFLPHTQAWAMAMAFEHERIHIETSTVLIRELPIECVQRPSHWPDDGFDDQTVAKNLPPTESSRDPAPNVMTFAPEGAVTLGKSPAVPTFGWDNEYGSRTQLVPSFHATQKLISHAEFLEFVVDGGYRESKFWSEEGWRWRQFRNTKWPGFWVLAGPAGLNQFRLRLIYEIVDWQPDLPVVVNFHEARAYCAWRTERDQAQVPYRLLSETEHHRLRQLSGQSEQPVGNAGLRFGSETSVSQQGTGFAVSPWHDVFGNVWQWCEDEFHPLPGFEVHPYYEDFSTPCFDGKHQMIMGGSFVSTGDEASRFARFHFRPHFMQHAGFRVVRPHSASSQTAFHFRGQSRNLSDYESDELLSQYLLLHFGDNKITQPRTLQTAEALSFPQRCAQVVIDWARREAVPLKRALEVGCATGGAVFELSSAFDAVTGVDLSDSFIKAAQTLKDRKEIHYRYKVEGDIDDSAVAAVASHTHPERTTFRQADACSLPAEYVGFNAVLLANLLCRLPSPKSCLSRMMGPRGLVAPGGLLVIVSPYSWLEEHTQKSAWLGGFEKNGSRVMSQDTLQQYLQTEFNLLSSSEMPLVIREHARKYQYIVSHLMVWKKHPAQ